MRDCKQGEKKRRRINEGIQGEKCREYFIEMFGGVEGKVVEERRKGRERDEEEKLGKKGGEGDKETENRKGGRNRRFGEQNM